MWMGFFVAGLTEWYFGDAEPMLIYLAVLGIALGGGHHAATGASSHCCLNRARFSATPCPRCARNHSGT
ncbi:MAG: hypothetical protein IPJ24_04850 [bacterium]|nr:hypothetical protein [bacterium]